MIITKASAIGKGAPARADQRLEQRVLQFMISNPSAWKASALGSKLRVKVDRLHEVLQQLRAEGKLVSCTVTCPDGRPREEYRIAAHTAAVDLYKFKIGKLDVPRQAGEAAPGRKRS